MPSLIANTFSPKNNRDVAFSPDYVQYVFVVWYDNNKPTAKSLLSMIKPDPVTGKNPDTTMLKSWVANDFATKAAYLDQQVAEQIDTTLVSRRLEMVERHAELGKVLQDKAIEYIREKGLGSSRNAIMALVHGVKIEKESRSAPEFLKNLSTMNDDQVIEEIKKLASSGVVVDVDPDDGLDD